MLNSFLIRISVSIVGGLLLAFSAPGYDLWFIAWIGLVPLFIVINQSNKISEALILAFIFGFCYNLNYLNWLFSLHPLTWLGLTANESISVSLLALIIPSVYNALFFVVFALGFILLNNSSPYKRGVANIALASLLWLIVFNKLMSSSLLFGFPWTLIEYSQYKNLFLIQIAEYLGSIWIGFLIVFFNISLANLLVWMLNVEKIGGRYVPRKPVAMLEFINPITVILILISFSLVFSVYSYGKHKQKLTLNSKDILLLQGNLPIKATRGRNLDIKLAKSVYSKLISTNKADLIVAPEGSLPTIFNQDTDTQRWVRNIAGKKGTGTIFGSYCKNDNKELFNCALLSEGKDYSLYEKERLVPFGEYIPFYFLLPSPLKKFADYAIGEGFKKGHTTTPLDFSFGKVGINICFELIFPALIRKHSLQGASVLVNLSDLSWFNSDLLKKQFLAFAVFRAIENRKPFIVATNSGISALIDPNGRIKSQTLPDTDTILTSWINPSEKITFYAKYGW